MGEVKIQALEVPGAAKGEQLVVLRLEDYQAMQKLIEELEDIRDGQLPVDHGEQIPAEVVQSLVTGANPIKVWRQYRGLTATELATKAVISQSHMSSIETGAREPSLPILKRLAEALGVDLDDLV